MKLSNIKVNPNNPRVIKDGKFNKLLESLREFPEMMKERPLVVVTDTDGKLMPLGGNMRLRALKELKYTEISDDWISIVDNWTDEQKRQFIVKDNLSYGEWDWDLLTSEYDKDELIEWGMDLYEFEDIEDVELEAEEDNYEIPEEVKTDIVLGDLFEIGEHRLLCGDSTDSEQVAKLMNGEKADMVMTDPPYGIDWDTDYTRFTGGIIPSENKYSKIQNDKKDFDPSYFLAMYEKCLFFGANCFSDKLPKGNWIVWDKRFENDKAFLADAEVAWYNGSGAVYIIKETHQGFVSSDKKRFHPTQKPVKLLEQIFEKIKAPDFLFDPYIGSGSTMVAAHQLKRKCYGMELDPKYCQVIIDRMKKLDPNLLIKKNGKILEG